MVAFIVAFALMQPVPSNIVTVAQGSYSRIEERTETAIRSASEWQAFWKSHGAGDPPASVDFAKEMVAAVFLGTRPTGGYSVEIASTRREGDALIVEYVERRPSADSIVTQALTSPFHIVKLPKVDGPVRFRNISASSPAKPR